MKPIIELEVLSDPFSPCKGCFFESMELCNCGELEDEKGRTCVGTNIDFIWRLKHSQEKGEV